MAKIPIAEAFKLREAYDSGFGVTALAKQFGISRQSVYRWLAYVKHLEDEGVSAFSEHHALKSSEELPVLKSDDPRTKFLEELRAFRDNRKDFGRIARRIGNGLISHAYRQIARVVEDNERLTLQEIGVITTLAERMHAVSAEIDSETLALDELLASTPKWTVDVDAA